MSMASHVAARVGPEPPVTDPQTRSSAEEHAGTQSHPRRRVGDSQGWTGLGEDEMRVKRKTDTRTVYDGVIPPGRRARRGRCWTRYGMFPGADLGGGGMELAGGRGRDGGGEARLVVV